MGRNDGFPPLNIDSDKESAFLSARFQAMTDNLGINQHFLENEDYRGTAHVDRFISTLRELLQRYFTAYNTRKYIEVLPSLVENYNTRYHRAIKSAPSAPNEAQARRTFLASRSKADNDQVASAKFKIGDRVRVLLRRNTFQKGTEPSWSGTVHRVVGFQNALWYVSDRMTGYKNQELKPVDVVEERPAVAGMMDDDESVQEFERGLVDRRRDRRLRQEGLDAVEAVAESNAPRERRERRGVDRGFFLS